MDEAFPVVVKAIEQAYEKYRRYVSVKQIVPLLLKDRTGRGRVSRAVKRTNGKHTPEQIASKMVAFFGQRWTMNKQDPSYSGLFEKFDRTEGPPWFYRARGRGRRQEGRVIRELARAGFQPDPEIRSAIEKHSMQVAKKYFEERGFVVDDRSRYQSYDLCCTKNGKATFVEVKGMQEDRGGVILTANEVKHFRRNRKRYILFIVHSIRIDGKNARGGRHRQIPGSQIDTTKLQAINYMLSL